MGYKSRFGGVSAEEYETSQNGGGGYRSKFGGTSPEEYQAGLEDAPFDLYYQLLSGDQDKIEEKANRLGFKFNEDYTTISRGDEVYAYDPDAWKAKLAAWSRPAGQMAGGLIGGAAGAAVGGVPALAGAGAGGVMGGETVDALVQALGSTTGPFMPQSMEQAKAAAMEQAGQTREDVRNEMLGAGLGAAAPAALSAAGKVAGRTGEIAKAGWRGTKQVAGGLSKAIRGDTETKREIVRLLEEGSGEVDEFGRRVYDPKTVGYEPGRPRLPEQRAGPESTKIERYWNEGGADVYGKAAENLAEQEALAQGFDRGVLSVMKGAGDLDNNAFLRMVKMRQRADRNPRWAIHNRPSDVAGDTLMKRYKVAWNTNRAAAAKMDEVTMALKDADIDADKVVEEFAERMTKDLDIGWTPDNVPIYEGSFIEDMDVPMAIFNRVIKRMKKKAATGEKWDAHDLHRLKLFLDDNIDYEKANRGLTGKSERIISKLRHDIDSLLDANFTEYNRINTEYSETIKVMDELQRLVGKKLDLSGGKNVEKAVGQEMRKLTSNYNVRIPLLNAIFEIEQVAQKYGSRAADTRVVPFAGKRVEMKPVSIDLTDDLLSQMMFVDELDKVFGPVQKTAFGPEISKAIVSAGKDVMTGGMKGGLAMKFLEEGMEFIRGADRDAAYKAMFDLLEGRIR